MRGALFFRRPPDKWDAVLALAFCLAMGLAGFFLARPLRAATAKRDGPCGCVPIYPPCSAPCAGCCPGGCKPPDFPPTGVGR